MDTNRRFLCFGLVQKELDDIKEATSPQAMTDGGGSCSYSGKGAGVAG